MVKRFNLNIFPSQSTIALAENLKHPLGASNHSVVYRASIFMLYAAITGKRPFGILKISISDEDKEWVGFAKTKAENWEKLFSKKYGTNTTKQISIKFNEEYWQYASSLVEKRNCKFSNLVTESVQFAAYISYAMSLGHRVGHFRYLKLSLLPMIDDFRKIKELPI